VGTLKTPDIITASRFFFGTEDDFVTCQKLHSSSMENMNIMQSSECGKTFTAESQILAEH